MPVRSQHSVRIQSEEDHYSESKRTDERDLQQHVQSRYQLDDQPKRRGHPVEEGSNGHNDPDSSEEESVSEVTIPLRPARIESARPPCQRVSPGHGGPISGYGVDRRSEVQRTSRDAVEIDE